jgi:plastocyanin
MRVITASAILAVVAIVGVASGGPAAEAGGGCHSDVFADEATTAVEMSKNCFTPTVARVQPGDTVAFTSNDPEAHSVTGVAGTWGNDENIRLGESVTYQFDDAGVFPYFCYFHPSMVGAIVVGDGRAASASTAGDSVKAVSAEVLGGEAATDEPAQAVEDDSGGGVAIPLVIGIGALTAMGGFVAATVLRRKPAER